MNRRTLGVASIVEAMLISISIATMVALAYSFFSSYMGGMHPDIKYVNVQADLCGKVLIVENIGNHPVTIYGLIEVGADSDGNLYTRSVPTLDTVKPGKYIQYNLDDSYNYVYIEVSDVRTQPIPNSCKWITITGYSGGGSEPPPGGGGGGGINPR